MPVNQDNEPLAVPSRPGWYWGRWKDGFAARTKRWVVLWVSADLYALLDGAWYPSRDFEWYAPAGTIEALEEPQ